MPRLLLLLCTLSEKLYLMFRLLHPGLGGTCCVALPQQGRAVRKYLQGLLLVTHLCPGLLREAAV